MPANSFVRVFFALVVAGAAVQSAAAEPDGRVIAVVQSANIDGQTGRSILQPEAPVFSGDRIDTGPVGEAQIRFRDETRLVVGPNSSMIIDAFVFNADDTAQQITINAVRGAFRFITGNSRKDAYSIVTPTATIGVRGTEFDVAIEAEGTTRVANFEGVTVICRRQPNGGVRDPGRDCVELVDPCTVSVIRPTRPDVIRYSNDDIEFRNRQLRYYFPYVRSQSNLLADFQVNVEQCLTAAVVPPSDPSAPPPGPPPPDPVPPLMPDAPVKPEIKAPDKPSPEFRDRDRPTYNHGPVFR